LGSDADFRCRFQMQISHQTLTNIYRSVDRRALIWNQFAAIDIYWKRRRRLCPLVYFLSIFCKREQNNGSSKSTLIFRIMNQGTRPDRDPDQINGENRDLLVGWRKRKKLSTNAMKSHYCDGDGLLLG